MIYITSLTSPTTVLPEANNEFGNKSFYKLNYLQTVIHPTKNRGTDMRTMSAEKFSGLVAAIQVQSRRVSGGLSRAVNNRKSFGEENHV